MLKKLKNKSKAPTNTTPSQGEENPQAQTPAQTPKPSKPSSAQPIKFWMDIILEEENFKA